MRHALEMVCCELVAAIKEVGKVGSFVDLFLITDVTSDDLLVIASRGYEVPTRPKVIAFVAALAGVFVGNVNCRLALQETDDVRHRVFRRDRYQHVHVVGHQVPFPDLATLLSSKSMQKITQFTPNVPVKALRSVLTREDHMVFAVPRRV